MTNNDDIHFRELMLRKLLYSINEEQEEELQRILSESPEARTLWEELQQTHQEPDMQRLLTSVDEEKEWEEMEARLDAMPVTKINRIWAVTAAAAACLLIVLIGNWYLSVNRNDAGNLSPSLVAGAVQLKLPDGRLIDLSGKDTNTIRFNEVLIRTDKGSMDYTGGSSEGLASITVPATKEYKLRLTDGSTIWLNSGTTLEFAFGFGATREVRVSGEAYFQVVHNGKPFIVHTPETDIEVLGTEFNVNTYDPGLVKASLVTGKISTKSHEESKPILLQPGQIALYSRKQGFVVQRFPTEQLGWRQGVYIFEGNTLQEISQVLNRCYGIKTVFERPQLAALRFTGVLKKSAPIENFLSNMLTDNRVAVELKNGVLHVK